VVISSNIQDTTIPFSSADWGLSHNSGPVSHGVSATLECIAKISHRCTFGKFQLEEKKQKTGKKIDGGVM
jgi:hypothetical protein